MRASLQYCVMDNIYKKHFFLVLLKIFWSFWDSSRNKSAHKQLFSGVYKIDVLKKFANYTKKDQCWSHFLKKCPEIKRLQHRCLTANNAKLLRTPSFLKSTFGRVWVCLLKSFTFRSSQKGFWTTSCKRTIISGVSPC